MRIRTVIFAIGTLASLVYVIGLWPFIQTSLVDLYRSLSDNFGNLPSVIVGAVITGGIAWIALRTNAAVNIRNKRMDVILHCNNRYDDLYKLRHELQRGACTRDEISSYFRRYWGLQSDQIDYWLAGYVDPETMVSWIISLTGSLERKTIGQGINVYSYAESWNDEIEASHRVVNKRLTETVNFCQEYLIKLWIPEHRYAAALQYLRILEAHEESLISILSRNRHSRIDFDDLAVTIPKSVSHAYRIFDVRRNFVKIFHGVRVIYWNTLSTILDFIQGNDLEVLMQWIDNFITENPRPDDAQESQLLLPLIFASGPPSSCSNCSSNK